MVAIIVPENYGLAVVVALGAIPLLSFIHGTVASSLRKKANVPYPFCYATIEQCKSNPKAEQYNCAQRAHSNFLENATQTMLFILIAGLKYPNAATIIGGAWLISRVAFLYGYVYSGKLQGRGRHLGSTFWLCQGALWALTVFGFARDLINI
ncbi:hypothetical protein Egran_06413 [Elaphomyces granulatus]|uniref:Glutathione S-transferase n=1 Tax=Elaphomyces granulatus TaxID=519963 RepID=A0A232LNU4_9EURO|nr:hypothetical protein Egran_06413 [Elaphomyces granulatus]